MSEHQQRFQALLRELFQFDSADLDFGIYRIMNHKRDVIERYIAEDLPKTITDEIPSGLAMVQETVRDKLGVRALDGDGNLQRVFHETPIGARYLNIQARQTWHVAPGADAEAFESTLYNHLYNFFSRYYDDGDFISKRRHSRRERYAIPYNGEEVHLHWANKDQYYIKTGEHFRNYAFKVGDISVRFVVTEANVEQGNVKGEKRYFFPRLKDAAWREGERELHLPFEFRPLTAADKTENGTNHLQEAIIGQALGDLPKHIDAVPLAALTTERHRNGDNPVTMFEYHLRRYTRRNTTDFFIHKDLKDFLTREFDFYLKHEVLNIDGVETTDEITAEGWARGWFQTLRLMRTAAGQVIDFLDQAESFQKMIWEKRKFVTDVQYCVSLRAIDPRHHPAIAGCDAQWQEWQQLYAFDKAEADLLNQGAAEDQKAGRMAFLASHPSLVVDTTHFDGAFVDELLASLCEENGLDERVDGLLVQSENFQAIGLLSNRYRGAAQCIYLDPPYNTDASAILYKNDYKDSAWLSLMADRLPAAKRWLAPGGVVCVAIDDEEASRLRLLMQQLFESELGVVAVRSNPAGRKSQGRFSPSHEYAFFFGDSQSLPAALGKTERQLARYPLSDDEGRYAWNNLVRHGSNDRREDRPKLYYPIYVASDDSIRVPELDWNDEQQEYRVVEEPQEGETAVWPDRSDEEGVVVEKNWHRGPDAVARTEGDYRVRRLPTGIEIDFKIRMDMDASPNTWWDDSKYASANRGPQALKDLFGDKNFDFAKSVPLVEDCLRASGCADNTMVLDFFAGSGTTAQAVINLNREDDGRRQFVLVEMGAHFEDVVLPRVKKVMFSPDWKAGRPTAPNKDAVERSPRIVKYIRLESFEDALNNIEFADAGAQQAMALEDYVIKYMLQWETRDSATLLNVEQLSRPFDYKLATYANGNGGTERADVAETFNYLLGLRARTRKVVYDDERKYLVYRGEADGQETVIVWRETAGWEPEDYRRDQQFLDAEKVAEGADVVYANGVCFLAGAKALEPLFKERMFAPLP